MTMPGLTARLSLRSRLLLGIVAVLSAVGLLTVVFMTIKESREYQGHIKQEMDAMLTVLEQELKREVIIGDFATIEEILRQRVQCDIVDAVAWENKGMSPMVARNDHSAAHRPKWFARLINLAHPNVSRPLVVGGTDYGRMTVSFTSVPHENRLWQSVLLTLGMLLIMLVLMVFLLIRIMQVGLAPLVRLEKSAWQIGAGDFNVRVAECPGDPPEMRLTVDAFNRMTASIETLLLKREQAEQALQQVNDQLEQKVLERTRSLEAANKKLATLSSTDGLTGIANRRRFDEVLLNEWRRAQRTRQPLALLMIDVDFFKNYNDLYGHRLGDDCLCKIAGILQGGSRRSSDLSARYGGEEFAIIAADTDAANALQLARSIHASIESLNEPHAGSPSGKVTVSIGVATMIPESTQQPGVLIEMADRALYDAKNRGRNRVCYFEQRGAPALPDEDKTG